MKTRLLLFLMFIFSGIISAQDTIFVKTGQKIPAIIIEKNQVEIKYKKFGQAEPAAIYSVFVSDILSIHYSDGIIADYTLPGQDEIDRIPKTALELAGTMKTWKFSLGAGGNYFSRNETDNLLLFWRRQISDNSAETGGNPIYYVINFKMAACLGQARRNWIGDEVQLTISPEDAIHVSNNDGSYDIKLRSTFFNIILFYGHTLNYKKNLVLMFQPGLEMASMSGYIKLNNINYAISGNVGMGFNLGIGPDWIISKRLMASARVGQRFMTIEEMHKDSGSPTGYRSFPVNGDHLSVKWSGTYASFGLTWSVYAKAKFMDKK
jgi:hypothetical protein